MIEQEIVNIELPIKDMILDTNYKETHDDMFRGLLMTIRDPANNVSTKVFPFMVKTCTATNDGAFFLVLKDVEYIYNLRKKI